MPGVATTALGDSSDAVAAGSIGSVAIDRLTGFNGSTYDRIRTLGAVSLNGLGQLSASPAVPGASVVKSLRLVAAASSTTRQTMITPTSGKRIRILSVWVVWPNTAGNDLNMYFGTGTTEDTTLTKIIFRARLSTNEDTNGSVQFPDGAGPVGAADEVLSVRNSISNSDNPQWAVHYREE